MRKYSYILLFILIGMAGMAHSQVPGSKSIPPGLPEGSLASLGVDSAALHHRVDSLVHLGIESEAFPGAQVLVAFQGKLSLIHI